MQEYSSQAVMYGVCQVGNIPGFVIRGVCVKNMTRI